MHFSVIKLTELFYRLEKSNHCSVAKKKIFDIFGKINKLYSSLLSM